MTGKKRRRLAALTAAVLMLTALAASARTTSAAQEAISETRRGPFIVRADFDLATLKNELALLDALSVEMRAVLRLPEFRENVVVRVFRSEAAWREFQRKNWGDAPYRRAMYDRKNYLFDRDDAPGRVYLYLNPEFEKDLRHEGAHAILGATLGRGVPIWLDEGIAEYFEAEPGERLTNPVWRAWTVERLRSGRFSTLESLEKIVGIEGMSNAKYGDSWAWVCWFLNGPEAAHEALLLYLGDGGAGKLFAAKPSKRLKALAKGGSAEESLRRFFAAE